MADYEDDNVSDEFPGVSLHFIFRFTFVCKIQQNLQLPVPQPRLVEDSVTNSNTIKTNNDGTSL